MPETLLDAITSAVSGESQVPNSGTEDTGADEGNTDEIESGTEETQDTGTGTGTDESTNTGEGTDASEDTTKEVVDEEGTPEEIAAKKAAADKTAADKAATDAAKTPEQLAAEKAAAPKVKDPVNDPIPNALKKDTRERMESLITTVKSLTKDRDAAMAREAEIIGYIEDTRATPEQYGQTLSYLKMVNSGDPVQMEKALSVMQNEVVALARMLGKPVPGVDMVSLHADLKEAVADGSMSQQHAEELAAARERGKIQTAQSQNRSHTEARNAQWRAEVAAGREAINAVGAQLKASDPQYEAKNMILVEALKPVIARANPSEWATIYKTAYDRLKLPTATRSSTVRTNVPPQQPLRAKSNAGGAVKQPSSMLDAITSAMGVQQ